ncbi:bacteriophage 186 Orf81-like protein [Deinococcus grandis]|uniref:Bacteriophage 186 Orf81-like protein n=1 Tax=Deinococcus grandis TaxID=57498 RepID=A0A100HNJ4_9DEIO|nr:hypothetical protein [Deinococcus grandis]GAQ23995.1 bacteriophage 186 Orf81-like protein [Deinococcus grandis]
MPRRQPVPKYVDEIPAHLATLDLLSDLGLKPGHAQPVALVELNTRDCQRLTGLFERAQAVPKEDTP